MMFRSIAQSGNCDMAMKLIYQNATNDEEPLLRTFVFNQETVGCCKTRNREEPFRTHTEVRLKVPKGGKVYATTEPINIIYHPDSDGKKQ